MAEVEKHAGSNETPARRPHLFDWTQPFRWTDLFKGMDQETMRIEEFDEAGNHVVRAEVPGIDPDKDVTVTVEHGVLTFSVERREEKRTEDSHGYRSEFRYGSFARSVRLPAGAKETDVKASYNDGILEIRFPVDAEKADARKIPITRG